MKGRCACGCERLLQGRYVWQRVRDGALFAGPCGSTLRGVVVI